MLHFLRSALLIVTFAFNSSFAFAEADLNSTNYIMPGCRALLELDAPKDMNTRFLSTECRAIIKALVHASSSNICPPKVGDIHDDIRVVVKYIDEQPTKLNEVFFAVALDALRAAWPCN